MKAMKLTFVVVSLKKLLSVEHISFCVKLESGSERTLRKIVEFLNQCIFILFKFYLLYCYRV